MIGLPLLFYDKIRIPPMSSGSSSCNQQRNIYMILENKSLLIIFFPSVSLASFSASVSLVCSPGSKLGTIFFKFETLTQIFSAYFNTPDSCANSVPLFDTLCCHSYPPTPSSSCYWQHTAPEWLYQKTHLKRTTSLFPDDVCFFFWGIKGSELSKTGQSNRFWLTVSYRHNKRPLW